ncbi:extradiol ring-cleavage dioxygenase [Caldibacillus lycopersici]|uniref:Extradiol ring-cleavage dioxygenase n=1 Tax=Perspicuibacillus lycopersici TaxID=1325689 RepID=A0AAE3LPH3_9BACI|nr:extradiol ring-cleavage dioxygenase [Perspicuibacillus lycopersici]MCU9614952.1 extradiol ring-cleavage dioxygenase [Perspicuibacillus lycopersici]
MNPFVFACITPHGGEIIPELSGSIPERMKLTRDSMVRLGKKMTDANPETIIVLTPHGTRIDGFFSVTNSERMFGYLEENDGYFELERIVDRELAVAITKNAQAKQIPIASINYGTAGGPISCLPLDWGCIVPLSFMPDVPIVVINPSRELPFESHLALGKVICEVVEKSEKRVALIASCDWSHAHDPEGPYGYDPAAKILDEEVVGLIRSNELEKMAELDSELIDAAKPDGIWQTLILAGAIRKEQRQIHLYSYEVPTYFGLICAEIDSFCDGDSELQ